MTRLAHAGLLCACLLALVLSGSMASAASAASLNQQSQSHVLWQDGQVSCEVVVPRQAGPVAYFAGQELTAMLSTSSGMDIPLLREPSHHAGGQANDKRVVIMLGDSSAARQAGIDPSEIERDGFVIRSMGNTLLIVGRDDMRTDVHEIITTSELLKRQHHFERGTLNGVYHFLETSVGARFYFPGEMGTVIPKHDTLRVEPMNVQLAPDHWARDSGYSGALPDGTNGPAAYPYKNMHRLRQRMQTQYIPNVHGLRGLDLVRRFGESNPEFFAMRPDGSRANDPNHPHPGQLCYSSGVREVIYQDAKAFLLGQSAESRNIRLRGGSHAWAGSTFQPGYFNIMPQDGFVPCNCDQCQKHLKGKTYTEIDRQDTSNFIWELVAEVANRLKQENVPGVVTMMAYPPYRDVPEIELPDNVMVMLAITGPWNVNNYDQELSLIKAWNAKLTSGHKVWLWNYISKHAEMTMPGVPCITPVAVTQYYKMMAPHIEGAYLGCASDRYLYQVLNTYLANRIFWDNDVDAQQLVDEYYQKMFGAAAVPMTRIGQRMENIWVERIAGNQVETALGPASIPPTPYTLWQEIYTQDEMDTLAQWFDEAHAAATGDEQSLARIAFMREQLLGGLAEQRQAYMKNLEALAALRTQATALAKGETITIDGRADETAWQTAQTLRLSPFNAKSHAAGSNAQPAVVTVRMTRDSEHLYVAFDVIEPHVQQLTAPRRKHDDRGIFKDSSVEIFLNPSGDHKRYYQIVVSASGAITDQAGTKLGSSQAYDWNWSSHAVAATNITAQGWTAEIAVPLNQLGDADGADDIRKDGFPANFAMNRGLTGHALTHYSWSPFLIHGFSDLQQFGHVAFDGASQTNLIRNPDFSEKVIGRTFGGWYYHPRKGNAENVWAIDTEHWVTQGQSLRIQSKTGKDHISIKQSLPGLKPDTTYRLSFSYRLHEVVPSQPGNGFQVSIWDIKNRYMPSSGSLTGTNPWRQAAFTYTTSSKINTDVTSAISLNLYHATGSVWIDNVELIEMSEQHRK